MPASLPSPSCQRQSRPRLLAAVLLAGLVSLQLPACTEGAQLRPRLQHAERGESAPSITTSASAAEPCALLAAGRYGGATLLGAHYLEPWKLKRKSASWLWTTGLYILATCCLIWSSWWCCSFLRERWRQSRQQRGRAASPPTSGATSEDPAAGPSQAASEGGIGVAGSASSGNDNAVSGGPRGGLTESLLGRNAAEEDQARLNRERFEESRRIAAYQMFSNTQRFFVCLSAFGIGLLIFAVVFYGWGWLVWWHYKDKKCDQPLEWWLIVMLCLPPLLSCARSRLITQLSMHGMIIAGAWMYWSCKTCQETNPVLYNYVRLFVIFLIVLWVLQMLLLFGLVGLAFWLSSYGLLDNDTGGSRVAGREGLIDEIETLPFSPDLFDEEADPECCVCQEEFSHEKTIKRTRCGHIFHKECLGDWLGNYSKTCPVCRLDLEDPDAQAAPSAFADLRESTTGTSSREAAAEASPELARTNADPSSTGRAAATEAGEEDGSRNS